MGRKKRKELKPWCWYCNREFDEEKVLIYHQKARHFKCHICGKKLYTGPGLSIHCMQVHRHTVKAIPNALPHRSDPDVEIYGTEGIPFLDIVARCKQKNVELVIKEKNIANAALPAKYERTLETPYGTHVERAIKPASPSTIGAAGAQPILKSYYTPSSLEGNSSCTPGDFSRNTINNGPVDQNINGTPREGPAKISAEKIVLPSERCRLYHSIEDISLEEHRLRFSKYSKLLNEITKSNQPPQPAQSQAAYPVYPYPYCPPGYPSYAYPYYPQPAAYPVVPPEYPVAPPVAVSGVHIPSMYQQPMMFPPPTQTPGDTQMYQQPPPNYY